MNAGGPTLAAVGRGACAAVEPAVRLDAGALEQLMPMHLIVAHDGRILRVARTLRKLRGGLGIDSGNLFEVFSIRRPRGARDIATLINADGGRLSLEFREGGCGHFKTVIVPFGEDGGALLNLSFGLSLVEAVQAYDLTAGDFAGTDLAIEMLYLVEAKSAALQESKKLNQRLQGAKNAAEAQALTDTLTGLKNRRALDHALARLVADRMAFSLLHLDLDHFKDVNDTYGHAAGDEVLQVVAAILMQETRNADIIARVGGDEFILVFRNLVDIRVMKSVANRLIARLEEPIAHGDVWLQVSGSIGLTTSEHSVYGSVDAMLRAADRALYASKRDGRGRVTVAGAPGPGIGF